MLSQQRCFDFLAINYIRTPRDMASTIRVLHIRANDRYIEVDYFHQLFKNLY